MTQAETTAQEASLIEAMADAMKDARSFRWADVDQYRLMALAALLAMKENGPTPKMARAYFDHAGHNLSHLGLRAMLQAAIEGSQP